MKTKLIFKSLRKLGLLRRELVYFGRALARDDEGQAILEYVLLLSAALGATIVMARSLLRVLDNGVVFLGAQLEKDLKTGRMPASYWRN